MKERWSVRWFRKRALLYHLLVVTIAPGCLWAAWWQIHRATSGNTLSYLYAVEWPLFSAMAVFGWWQLIHEDPAAVDARKVERARRAATRGPFVPPPADADSGFTTLPPADRAGIGPGAAPRPIGGLVDATGDLVVASRPGAAGGIDHRRAQTDVEPIDDEEESDAVHALSSYNAYLARLSAGGGRKSWRNPHGVAGGAPRSEHR